MMSYIQYLFIDIKDNKLLKSYYNGNQWNEDEELWAF